MQNVFIVYFQILSQSSKEYKVAKKILQFAGGLIFLFVDCFVALAIDSLLSSLLHVVVVNHDNWPIHNILITELICLMAIQLISWSNDLF